MDFSQYSGNDPSQPYVSGSHGTYRRDGVIYRQNPGGLDLYPGHAAYSGWLWHQPAQKIEYAPERPPELPLSGAQATAEPGSDIVDTLLADRLAGLDANIERIRNELDARDRVHQSSLYGIDVNMMECRTELFGCDQWIPATNSLIERRRSQLEGKLLDLEREKRAEDMMNWRDRQTLLGELREVLTERRNAARRIDLLEAFPDETDKPDPGPVTG